MTYFRVNFEEKAAAFKVSAAWQEPGERIVTQRLLNVLEAAHVVRTGNLEELIVATLLTELYGRVLLCNEPHMEYEEERDYEAEEAG